MLRYEHVEFLNLLYGIPLVIFAIFLHLKWKENKSKIFGEKKLLKQLINSYSKSRELIKNTLTILIFIFLIVGISNPQIGSKMEEVKRKGIDLMIAIDLSNSMMAEDIQPNRLERAKQAISKLIDQLTGDRIGLIVFAGDAYVQLPITTDYSAAKLFLSTINTQVIPTQGTEIGKAIDLAVNSFDKKNKQNKAIIIITDGESHDENAIKSARNANESGIQIYTLGMGLSKGGPIPIYDKYGNMKNYRQDANGNTVISKLNENLLKEIASSGGGVYIRANNSKSGLSNLFDEINKLEKMEIGTMIFTQYKDRFQLFIGIALILLLLDMIIINRKNKWGF